MIFFSKNVRESTILPLLFFFSEQGPSSANIKLWQVIFVVAQTTIFLKDVWCFTASFYIFYVTIWSHPTETATFLSGCFGYLVLFDAQDSGGHEVELMCLLFPGNS